MKWNASHDVTLHNDVILSLPDVTLYDALRHCIYAQWRHTVYEWHQRMTSRCIWMTSHCISSWRHTISLHDVTPYLCVTSHCISARRHTISLRDVTIFPYDVTHDSVDSFHCAHHTMAVGTDVVHVLAGVHTERDQTTTKPQTEIYTNQLIIQKKIF